VSYLVDQRILLASLAAFHLALECSIRETLGSVGVLIEILGVNTLVRMVASHEHLATGIVIHQYRFQQAILINHLLWVVDLWEAQQVGYQETVFVIVKYK